MFFFSSSTVRLPYLENLIFIILIKIWYSRSYNNCGRFDVTFGSFLTILIASIFTLYKWFTARLLECFYTNSPNHSIIICLNHCEIEEIPKHEKIYVGTRISPTKICFYLIINTQFIMKDELKPKKLRYEIMIDIGSAIISYNT